ncbi:unnamed protein product [Microthlaspi erraticum]|uniref:TFIIS N-terminal domain-containing protein n=1 Tax=Microthlaspi erraticum TaxID=1685480 RepID=A0A6D2KJR8_9BRAS|nr:unnamed protein product [Microthlaspi erraticum]
MMNKINNTATATERSDFDLDRLVSAATEAANSNSIDGVEICFEILQYLKSLSLNIKDLLRYSKTILPLENLRDHRNPKVRHGANVLFNSWTKTLYSRGRNPSSSDDDDDDDDDDCNKAIPLNLKKSADVVKLCSKSKKKQHQIPELLGLKKNEEDETNEIDQNLNKADACKSVSTKSKPHKMKKQPHVEVSENPKYCPAVKKNSTEMLELFEIAKKSADVANTKGLLLAKAETSICVETLSLLMSFPISSTATDTRRIMEKLANLTRHKDRKVCNSAATLLQHWSQSIRDQQHKDVRKSLKANVTR